MSEGSTNSAGEFLELTIPVTISVRIGGPTHAGAAPAIAVESDSVRPEEDYGSRPGFDANFLGVRLSLPKPQNTIFRDVAALADGSYELKYHHYSVVMNKKRRLAFVSAVNLDADAPFRHERKGKDRWYLDPRMDEELQAANEFYSANPLDRGHLTRRADVRGDTARKMRSAPMTTLFTGRTARHSMRSTTRARWPTSAACFSGGRSRTILPNKPKTG